MLPILSVTQLLSDYRNGQVEAMESLFPIVYQELRRIAQAQLRHMPSIQTICTTALVHEAYLKLVQPTHPGPGCRDH